MRRLGVIQVVWCLELVEDHQDSYSYADSHEPAKDPSLHFHGELVNLQVRLNRLGKLLAAVA
jgi:hypothetical protein